MCQDMFFSRTQNTSRAQSLIGSSSPRPALEMALAGTKNPDDRMNVIGEMIDMKVDSPARTNFSTQVRQFEIFCRVLWSLSYFDHLWIPGRSRSQAVHLLQAHNRSNVGSRLVLRLHFVLFMVYRCLLSS